MSTKKKRHYRFPALAPGMLRSALLGAVDTAGLERSEVYILQTLKFDNDTEQIREIDSSQLWAVCEIGGGIAALKRGPFDKLIIDISSVAENRLTVTVDAENPDLLSPVFESIERSLSLTPVQASSPGDPLPSRSSGSDSQPLELPAPVTVQWLVEHVPLRLWLAVIGALISVFLAGLLVGQTSVARELLRGLGLWVSGSAA